MGGFTNIDLVPSTNRPPSGGSFERIGAGGCAGEAMRGMGGAVNDGGKPGRWWGSGNTGDFDEPAPGDCGGRGPWETLDLPERLGDATPEGRAGENGLAARVDALELIRGFAEKSSSGGINGGFGTPLAILEGGAFEFALLMSGRRDSSSRRI